MIEKKFLSLFTAKIKPYFRIYSYDLFFRFRKKYSKKPVSFVLHNCTYRVVFRIPIEYGTHAHTEPVGTFQPRANCFFFFFFRVFDSLCIAA